MRGVCGILRVMQIHQSYLKKVTNKAFVGVWIFFVISLVALRFNLYYTIPWLDSVMHFLGGGLVAYIVYAFLGKFFAHRLRTRIQFFILAVTLSLSVGIAWEIIEYSVNYYIPTYVWNELDTAHDLLFDILGSLGALGYIFYKEKK